MKSGDIKNLNPQAVLGLIDSASLSGFQGGVLIPFQLDCKVKSISIMFQGRTLPISLGWYLHWWRMKLLKPEDQSRQWDQTVPNSSHSSLPGSDYPHSLPWPTCHSLLAIIKTHFTNRSLHFRWINASSWGAWALLQLSSKQLAAFSMEHHIYLKEWPTCKHFSRKRGTWAWLFKGNSRQYLGSMIKIWAFKWKPVQQLMISTAFKYLKTFPVRSVVIWTNVKIFFLYCIIALSAFQRSADNFQKANS